MFTGSYVALVTPMFDDGQIDYPALRELVEFHIQQGTHGIVSVGTTGESATLPFDEHIEVVRQTVEAAAGRTKIIAGSGANSTSEAIFLSEQMAGLGIEGFLSVVPYYNNYGTKLAYKYSRFTGRVCRWIKHGIWNSI